MSIQCLQDRNQTIYIGLYNTCNSFCYYISAIQRLHSSTTLNQTLLDITLNSTELNLLDLAISPLYYYAKLTKFIKTDSIGTNLNQSTVKETHNIIKNKIEELIGYFDVSMLNGGSPDNVLVTFLIPILYIKFKDINLIKQIIKEINFNPSRLTKLMYAYNNRCNFKVLRDNNLDNRIESSYKDLVQQLDVNALYKDYSIQFNISTISIYLQDANGNDSNYAGHAINLVYGYTDFKNNALDLYVIDDSTMIIPLKTYIQTHIDRIKYFEIQDATDEVLKLISEYCEVNKRLHRDVIKPNVIKLQLSQSTNKSSVNSVKSDKINLVGGNSNSIKLTNIISGKLDSINSTKNNVVSCVMLLMLVILLIIIIVVVILHWIKSHNSYKQLV